MMVGQAWSLSSELWFYAIAPFIVTSRRRTLICLAIALALRFFLLTICGQRSGIWGMFFFPGAACMFLLGSAAYHLRKMLPRPEWHPWVGLVCLLAFFTWVIQLKSAEPIILASRADWSVDEPRFWVLYVLFALAVPFIFQFSKNSKIDRQLGDLSYPLYLIHGVIVGILLWWKVPFGAGYPSNLVIASLLCLLAAFALNKVIEAPAEALRTRLKRPLRARGGTGGELPSTPGTDAASS